MTALHDYRSIWRVVTRREGQAHFLRRPPVVAVVGAVATTYAFAFAGQPVSWTLLPRVAVGGFALWMAVVWLMLFLPASLTMNSAANAKLVPRQRRRLMQMAATGWLLASCGSAVAAADWHVAPFVGVCLLGSALAFGGNALGMCLVIVAGNAVWLVPAFLPPAALAAVDSPAGWSALVLALLAAAGWSLHGLYPAGGDAHLAQQARRAAFLKRAGPRDTAWHAGAGAGSAWSARGVYRLALRRDCRSGDPARLLMHALGPVAHWSAWIAGTVTILALGGIARLLFFWTHAEGVRALLAGGAGLGLMALALGVVFSTAQVGQMLRRHAGEQALLRLTPLAGDAALLNRRLAGQLLRRALLNWAILTAAIVVTTIVVDAGPGIVLRQFALCCLAGQVAMIGLLGDYARSGGWSVELACLAALLAAVEGAVAVGLGWWNATAPWPWLIALAFLGVALQLVWGWRAMLAAPCAFPAGRMA